MKILGVDPGGSGALALLTGNGLSVEVADMPALRVKRGRGYKTEVDVRALYDLLASWAPNACYFERVQGMEGDGASSAFNFGRAAGVAEATVKMLGARFVFVTPPVWKKRMGLIGKAKDDSRAKAMDLWPSEAAAFRRKKDDGRADAALIAEYGRLDLLEGGVLS